MVSHKKRQAQILALHPELRNLQGPGVEEQMDRTCSRGESCRTRHPECDLVVGTAIFRVGLCVRGHPFAGALLSEP